KKRMLEKSCTSRDRNREWVWSPAYPWLFSWLLRISWLGYLPCSILGTRNRQICLRADDFARQGFSARRSSPRLAPLSLALHAKAPRRTPHLPPASPGSTGT